MRIGFTKGIHTNSEPVQTPAEYYSDALNMRTSGGAKRTEEGNLKLTGVPGSIVQWGQCSIGNRTIILGTLSGKSIIGSLDINDIWTLLVPPRAGVDVLGIVGATQVEGKKNWAGEDIIYFSTPNGSRRINLSSTLPTDDTEFDKITSLFLEYSLPKVSYVQESGSGELLSGVYQFAARLITESGASTPFGVMGEIIPVVKSSLNSSRASVVGDEPQTVTSKAIDLSITNVDTSFKYIQLGILTYVGVSNTATVNQSVLIPINSQSIISYTYRGAADNTGTLSVNELIASGVTYSTGEFITQKDGVLLIGAPTEAEQPNINWFRVAQNIIAKYIIKKIPYKEAIAFSGSTYTAGNNEDNYSMVETSTDFMDQGYKNPITCALYKGYRRNEVYALTLTPIFTGGVYGPTVHIPSSSSNPNPINTPGDPDSGTLGTYISGELYPDDRYTGLIGTGLRLHKFPDAVLQPIIEGNVETNNCYIRVLGIELSNITLDPSEMQYANKIEGFIIGRVDRRGQETQLAQGIVRPNTNIRFNNNNTFSRCTTLADGYTDWFIDISAGGSATQGEPTGSLDLTDFTFVAPDLIHKKYDSSQATHIKQHSIYKADPYAAPLDFNHGSIPNTTFFNHHYSFFKNIKGLNTTQFVDQTETELDGLRTDVSPFGVPLAPNSKGGKINTTITMGAKKLEMCSSNGFTWFQTLNATSIKYHRDYNSYYECNQRSGKGTYWGRNTYLHKTTGFRANFVLHTLTRKNTKQYGALDQMTSMFVHYEPWKAFNGTVQFFNGDTFISKYGLTLADEALFPYADNTDNAEDYVNILKPANYSGIVYFWLESDNNYDYRHYIQPSSYTEDEVTASGSMPFYPAYKQIVNNTTPFGLLSMHAENWISPGYADRYNTQYSTQPTAKPFVITPPEDIIKKGSLVNRIIYSDQAVQGEKADAYQIFLPNNYYDVPQEFGELTDVYVNADLYASTSQVQWRLFFNTLASQATSIGEIILGTGGAFARPAVPMTTISGGYGGTSHWTHAVNTVFGRMFVDKVQGKFFKLTDKLEEFSRDLSSNYRLKIQNLQNVDILVGSEPLRERIFIKTLDEVYSYNLEQDLFISKHSFNPRWMFSHGPYMYSNNTDSINGDTGIFKHSLGATGVYYGVQYPAYITLVANMDNTVSKQFLVIEALTRRFNEAGLNIPFHTFNKMEVWNDERYTGVVNITPQTSAFQVPGVLEVLARKVKDSFRIDLSRDIVINPEINIFSTSNHSQLKEDLTITKWLPRMRGNYIQIKLITTNIQGPLFLYDVLIDVAENIR